MRKYYHYLGESSEPPVQEVPLSYDACHSFSVDHWTPQPSNPPPLKIPEILVQKIPSLPETGHLSAKVSLGDAIGKGERGTGWGPEVKLDKKVQNRVS